MAFAAKSMLFVPGIFAGIMLALLNILATMPDPIEIGGYGERLTIVGILIAANVMLITAISYLYMQNSKYWQEHHTKTVIAMGKELTQEREQNQEDKQTLIRLLRECSEALKHSAITSDAVKTSIDSLRILITELERHR